MTDHLCPLICRGSSDRLFQRAALLCHYAQQAELEGEMAPLGLLEEFGRIETKPTIAPLNLPLSYQILYNPKEESPHYGLIVRSLTMLTLHLLIRIMVNTQFVSSMSILQTVVQASW
jgi:hypothetical protein